MNISIQRYLVIALYSVLLGLTPNQAKAAPDPECPACMKIVNYMAIYEDIEESIEEWVLVGHRTTDEGELGEAIYELRTYTRNLLNITGYIEWESTQHVCTQPEEELPEYIPPTEEQWEGDDDSNMA